MSEPAAAPEPVASTPAASATEPTTNPAEAPRSMPASAPVADAADVDYNPSQDDAAGFAAFRAATGEPDAAPATTESGKADVVAAAVADATGTTPEAPAPQAEAADPYTDPADAKLNKIFNRIAHLERERDEARSSLSRLESRAARADELERLESEMKSNPTKALERLGWNQDTLAEFILKGNEATSPKLTAVEQEQRALKQELEQLRRERFEAERETKIRAYVAEIPSQLKDELPQLPHVSAYYDSPSEMAEAIWTVQRNAYQTQKTELTPVEAARAVEKVLADQAKRFSRARSQNPAPSTNASAPKPAAPAVPQTLTNRATAAPLPTSAGESDDVSPNYAAAVELMRAARK